MSIVHLALNDSGRVIAQFEKSADAAEFCAAKYLCHMPFNTINRELIPCPQVGQLLKF